MGDSVIAWSAPPRRQPLHNRRKKPDAAFIATLPDSEGRVMHFKHSDEIWESFPELIPGVLHVEGITETAMVDQQIAKYNDIAESRLAEKPEGEFPEIQAWRRAFSRMELKPTQYRCAAESLLRRFKKEKSLPRIHPLIDVCNAMSLAFAIPVAVFDVSKIANRLEVRHATGEENYLTFSGDIEHPDTQEVIFGDDAGRAHARRWTNRQSGYSAVQAPTTAVLIVGEAMHASAPADMEELTTALADELGTIWSVTPKHAILSRFSPQFEF